MRQNISLVCNKIISWGLVAILVIMPFHAFLSIFIGSLGFSQALVQSWKEGLILLLGFVWLVYNIAKNRFMIKFDAVNVIFFIIIFLSIFTTILVHPSSKAILFGIKTNLVAIALYFIAQIPLAQKSFIKKNLSWLIIIPGLVVSIFAILQSTLISPDILINIGYNSSTIDPRQIVDGSLKFYRAFSTLGGPNQLGAYLIIPLVFCLAYAIKNKKWYIGILSIPIYTGILLSYSRSAWIGSVLAGIVCVVIMLNKKQRIIFLSISVLIMLVGSLVLYNLASSNQKLQNVLLHGRYFENQIQGSDSQRLDALATATAKLQQEPFGHGLGSAGPASYQSSSPVISENWYLQIAYEIGVIGLMLYIAAFTGLLGEFIRDHKNPLATALFSATAGILVINLFLHAWADSTLVLIMFSLYGLYKGKTT
jgi:O-antigen ligase